MVYAMSEYDPAKVLRNHDDGIDHQRARAIVSAQLESVGSVGILAIAASNGMPRSVRANLIGHGMFLDQIGNQIAMTIHVRRPVQTQPDPLRVGARIHREIVFEFPAVAVVDQIDAPVQALHFQTAEVRNRVAPFRAIVAEIQIRSGIEQLRPLDRAAGLAPSKLRRTSLFPLRRTA